MSMDFSVTKELKCLMLRSPECCGWVQVSNFYGVYGKPLSTVVEDIKSLSSGECLFDVISGWSHVYLSEPEPFTLFCVLTDAQVWAYGKLLSELGWVTMPRFANPNTNNFCTPYMFIPPELTPDKFEEREDNCE